MGLDIQSIRFHCWLKTRGISFKRVAMLGRQNFQNIDARRLARVIRRSGLSISDETARNIFKDEDGYVEPFYKWLGAESIESFDVSKYENATNLWDMNKPLPEVFRNSYDFVFDGGTLEHVFQYNSALREALTLCCQSGNFLSVTPANSYLGHGFYQLSPDLAFQALRPENGYITKGVFLAEDRSNACFHEVKPPEERGRAIAATTWPTLMFFWGQRLSDVPAILSAQQPDYEAAWQCGKHVERNGNEASYRRFLSIFAPHIRNDLLRYAKLFLTVLHSNALLDRKSFIPRKDI